MKRISKYFILFGLLSLLSQTSYGFYQPSTGKFLSREPLGEGASLNLFTFCLNDPVNRIDVLGLKDESVNLPDNIKLVQIGNNAWFHVYGKDSDGLGELLGSIPFGRYDQDERTLALIDARRGHFNTAVHSAAKKAEVGLTVAEIGVRVASPVIDVAVTLSEPNDSGFIAKVPLVGKFSKAKRLVGHVAAKTTKADNIRTHDFSLSAHLNGLKNLDDDIIGQLFDGQKLEKILESHIKSGGTFMMGDDAARLLRAQGAGAMYLPRAGGPGTLIFGSNPTRLQVLEELIHLGQYNRLGHPALDSVKGAFVGARFEIEAQDKLLRLARKKGWTQAEIDVLTRNRASWVKHLDELAKKYGDGY